MTDKQVRSDEARRNLRDLLDEVALGARITILRYDKPAAVLVPVLTDADRSLAARARTFAAVGDEAALRQHTGETDSVLLAYVRALGEAQDLLGELADRLDPPAQITEENHG